MTRIAALTHVREDAFFTDIWIRHYSGLVGRENLHIMLDGTDWTPTVDLSGISTSIMTGFKGDQNKDDRRVMKFEDRMVEKLLETYDYVIRTDADELVMPDPGTNLTIADVARESDEFGTRYVSGLDLVQNMTCEGPLTDTQPILSQRRYGVISKWYMKPMIFSRLLPLNQGSHIARGVPPIVSENIFMFHLTAVDKALTEKRYAWRHGINDDFQKHQVHHFAKFDAIEQCENLMDMDEAFRYARVEFQDRNGRIGNRPQNFSDRTANGKIWINGEDRNVYLVEIPKRFEGFL
jgi:hypothetical protein